MSPSSYRPKDESDVAAIVREAHHKGRSLAVIGHDSSSDMGRPMDTDARLHLGDLAGIVAYDPENRIITAKAGTKFSQIETFLAQENQWLPCDPLDMGPLFGRPAGARSLGGVIATNLSGPGRIGFGAIRDYLSGLRVVTGAGDMVVLGAGGESGPLPLPLHRALVGSWGTLAVITEVTLQLRPHPPESVTLYLEGLDDNVAISALSAAFSLPLTLSGAIHMTAPLSPHLSDPEFQGRPSAVTALRLLAERKGVASQLSRLEQALSAFGPVTVLEKSRAELLWQDMRQLAFVQKPDTQLWRLSVLPTHAPPVVAAIRRSLACQATYDWGGGLIWLEIPPSRDAGATDIRRVVARYGGDALLVRAEPAIRANSAVFPPLPPTIMGVIARLKRAWDPKNILNPGRLYATM